MKHLVVTDDVDRADLSTLTMPFTVDTVRTESEIPYNNLDFPPDFFPIGIGSEFKLGQQFQLKNQDSVEEVTLCLFKEGLPSGLLQVEIWTDNGCNVPQQYLGTLGSIHAYQLTVEGDLFTFSNPILKLQPYQSYWIVLNFEAASVSFDAGIGWTTITGSEPKDQAVKAVVMGNSTGNCWKTLAEFFGFPAMNYLQMLVSTSRYDF